MSLYFAKGAAASLESKHYKTNPNGTSKHEQAWSSIMPNGFPRFPKSTFPNDQPPTLFHPASPKLRAAKHVKDVDNVSMMSTSTFASTVSLLKENLKTKFHLRDKNVREAADTAAYEKKTPSLNEASPRAQTAEAYRVMATTNP